MTKRLLQGVEGVPHPDDKQVTFITPSINPWGQGTSTESPNTVSGTEIPSTIVSPHPNCSNIHYLQQPLPHDSRG